jgi:Glycosyl hydrolases family 39/Cep192 domain 4
VRKIKIQTHRFVKLLLSALPLAYGCVAPAQNISVSPKLIPFPNQGIGFTSAPLSVTLWNNQSGTLTIASIQVSPPFAQTNTCGSSVQPNGKCSLSITFTPTAKQYYSSKLVITDSAGNSPQSVTLTGNGVIPVTFSPAQVGFPSQATGTTSSGTIVAMKNNLSVPIAISSVQTAAPFAVTNSCGTSLAAGGSCNLNVTFSPTAVKYYSGSLTITDSAPTSPQTLGLGGNGVVPVAIVPKVGGLYSNHQIVNTPSTPQPVTLTNNLSTPLTFSGITTSPVFPFTSNCGNGNGGGSLAPGATCTVQISFDPQAVTSYKASLAVSDNAPGSPQVIPLQGAGIAGTPGPTVTVTPSGACILPSATQQYTANITGTPSTSLKWYVSAVLGGNSIVGTITSSGLYMAPSTSRTATIKAVTQGSPSYSGFAPVTVTTSPTFSIYPFVASIPVGGQQNFQAQACLVPDSNVSFTVDGIPGGNSTVGIISSTGVYTAPSTAGKHTVRVSDSKLDKSSGGVVTVFSSITADFGSRANNTAPVPPDIFGYGRGESLVSTDQRNLLTDAGVTVSRMSAQIFNVFKSGSTPDWTKIDPWIATVQAAGQHAILQLNQSPTWLQPTTGLCAGNSFAAPTDVNAWVQIVVQYVQHMDATFPGVVSDYEIWNEPNATGMCTTANHLNTYLALYAAAAPAMKAQAAQDGKTIRIGGPVLSGYSLLWLSNLLTNPGTAPYVDFISYHQYFFGQGQLQAQWDAYTGFVSLYEAAQDASNGAVATYTKFVAQAAAGKQPGGAQTPIYVTEYNDNWAFFNTCCRNDPTYAPLFNALYLTDMLNSVYSGSPRVPGNIDYFAGSAYPWFCLIGHPDTNSDCLNSVGASLSPFPQYYAFQLIASPQYLGLSAGGYMAKSMSAPTGGGGLATTAFYTSTKDAVVVINPTSTPYSQITVTLANPGLSGTQGTLYQIVNGAQVSTTPISFSTQGSGLSTTISVPPYSVQAVSLP